MVDTILTLCTNVIAEKEAVRLRDSWNKSLLCRRRMTAHYFEGVLRATVRTQRLSWHLETWSSPGSPWLLALIDRKSSEFCLFTRRSWQEVDSCHRACHRTPRNNIYRCPQVLVSYLTLDNTVRLISPQIFHRVRTIHGSPHFSHVGDTRVGAVKDLPRAKAIGKQRTEGNGSGSERARIRQREREDR